MILYSHNRTSTWLESQPTEQKQKLFKAARSLAPSIRLKFRARQEELRDKQLASVARKQKELAKREQKAIAEKERISKEISEVGFWTTSQEVDSSLAKLSGVAVQRKVLKLQLQFRQKVMGQVVAVC